MEFSLQSQISFVTGAYFISMNSGRFITRNTFRFIFFIIFIFGMFNISLGCNFHTIDVQKVCGPRGIPDETAFEVDSVRQHFGPTQFSTYGQNLAMPLACVDGRSLDKVFGTPGGEFSELVMGIGTYFSLLGLEPSVITIRDIMLKYISGSCSKTRPFYYHTEKRYIDDLFEKITPKPSIFPSTEPESPNQWYELFVRPEFQGCGHIRKILEMPTEYGFKDSKIVEMCLQEFLRIYWTANIKEKLDFKILQGELAPKAIVSLVNDGPSCRDWNSPVFPTLRGSSVFVHHPNVVDDYRKNILVPFFRFYDPKMDTTKFERNLLALGDFQLNATLALLDPAFRVNQFLVKIQTLGQPPIPTDPNLVTYLATFFSVLGAITLCAIIGCICAFYVGRCTALKSNRESQTDYKEMLIQKDRQVN